MRHPLLRHPIVLVLAFLVLSENLCSLLAWLLPQIMIRLGRHTPAFIRDLRLEFDLAAGVFIAAFLVRALGPWPRLAGTLVDTRKVWQGIAGLAGMMATFFLVKALVDRGVPVNHHFPVAFVVLLSLCAAVVEECAYRGYVLPCLESRYGTASAVVGSMIVFGGVHLLNGGPYGLASCFLIAMTGGLLFASAFVLTRRLYLPIGLHWGYDIVSFFLLGGHHFHPLYKPQSAQVILLILNLAEAYTGIFFLYLAHKRGHLRLSEKSEAFLRSLRQTKASSPKDTPRPSPAPATRRPPPLP